MERDEHIPLERKFSLGYCEYDDFPPGFLEILEGGKKPVGASYVQFGLIEEAIVMIVFEDESFEVGVGEALRPYICIYRGSDELEASRLFVEEIVARAR